MNEIFSPNLFIVMGVSGCGKSSVASKLAEMVQGDFIEGDDLHPEANREKMRQGTPLTDEDRWDWLTKLAETMLRRDGPVFASCSALKKSYRDHINSVAGQKVIYVYLEGSRAVLLDRLTHRSNHFMPASLLDSQLQTLERPGRTETAIIVPIEGTLDEVIQRDGSASSQRLGASRQLSVTPAQIP